MSDYCGSSLKVKFFSLTSKPKPYFLRGSTSTSSLTGPKISLTVLCKIHGLEVVAEASTVCVPAVTA